MAKYSNTIYFSLDKDSRDRLEALANENESIGLVAKRLILEMIGEPSQSSPLPPDIADRLSDLTERLSDLEGNALHNALGRFEAIESRLEKLESLQRTIAAVHSGYQLQNDRLNKLEAAIAKLSPDPAPQETAIMIQKNPLPLAIAPSVCLSHDQAAELFGKSPRTIKGWAKDPDRWPDGWIYDSDKNYWTKHD